MRHLAIVGVLSFATLLIVALLILSPSFAQRPSGQAAGQGPGQAADANPPRPGFEVPLVTPGPGWKACPHCENEAYKKEDRKKANVDARPFDAHDLSGIWSGNPNDLEVNGTPLDTKSVPALTPYGQKLMQANESTTAEWNSKDPVNGCDPMGWPRWITYNFGFQFVTLPDRVVQFIEWGHTWRDIWTDGRKLPVNPPIPRYLGYAVGHWEGDTFVVESDGYDDRSWLALSAANGTRKPSGYPHSDQMRVEERYKRVNYGLLQFTLTITDPKIYTAPWSTTGRITLLPNVELAEHFCVPSETVQFNNESTIPSLSK